MAEYIEREAAVAIIEKHMANVNDHCYSVNHNKEQYDIYAMATNHAIDYVRCVPAADVAPVVRCGECIHRRKGIRSNCHGRHPNWFCADGERREDG